MPTPVYLLIGLALGFAFGMYIGHAMALNQKAVNSHNVMHVARFNQYLRDINEALEKIPQDVVDSTRVRYSAELSREIRRFREAVTGMPEAVIDGIREAFPNDYYGKDGERGDAETETIEEIWDNPIPEPDQN